MEVKLKQMELSFTKKIYNLSKFAQNKVYIVVNFNAILNNVFMIYYNEVIAN